jgi:hypothetical protein
MTMLEKMIAAVKADIGAQMSARPLLGDHILGDWHARGDLGVVDLDRCCRAALEVLREPSEEVAAVAKYDEYDWAARNFTAMIDAILNEKTP